MTTRERWIVYPLLFLALGIALRDKLIPPTHTASNTVTAHEIEADNIRCNTFQAGRAKCTSLATDKVRWKEADFEAGSICFGVRLSDEPVPGKRPEKTDEPD